MSFPIHRSRRLRKNEMIRQLVSETRLNIKDFVYPLFISEIVDKPESINSMPGIFNFPVKMIAAEALEIYKLGIPAVILFGTPKVKDATGSSSIKTDSVIAKTVREIKNTVPDIIVITDICLCEYTDHGHCGIIKNGDVDNDATLETLSIQAVRFSEAGADILAPSDMMDGRVQAIRKALDGNGFDNKAIMSYSAKYCSSFYGPFREAAGSAPQFGDRKSYQMNPPNWREALKEIQYDIDEGADIVMVKPALSYLDIISKARDKFNVPIAAYNVSGEYSMVKLAAEAKIADEKKIAVEILTSIKRAGADIIISYHAKDAAKWLN